MQNLIITKLADLHAGDRILSWDGRPYRPVRVVAQRLGYIGAGSGPGRTSREPPPDQRRRARAVPVADGWPAIGGRAPLAFPL